MMETTTVMPAARSLGGHFVEEVILSIVGESVHEYITEGHTKSGAPFYELASLAHFKRAEGARWIYFDPACDGNPATAPRWIISDIEPNTSAPYDLDGDGACTYFGYIISNQTTAPPSGEHVWYLYCNSEEGCINTTVVVSNATVVGPATTAAATTTTPATTIPPPTVSFPIAYVSLLIGLMLFCLGG
eukprot:CAMPEP_0179157506 /NCGR_PEP_ID=MMETSP0796-20121207/76824_1 /TAXON_ID=73915 /ORGANISM="Pyrodinium bahamense, Strain pbaha01" /LENGTH=187 /DNA_ID=CAMNT_0020859137 /DNA_START=14 /DNA_END=574 /DNA_ORIENTATION=-